MVGETSSPHLEINCSITGNLNQQTFLANQPQMNFHALCSTQYRCNINNNDLKSSNLCQPFTICKACVCLCVCGGVYVYFNLILFRSNSILEKPEDEAENQMIALRLPYHLHLETSSLNILSVQNQISSGQILCVLILYNSIKEFREARA